ncbi:MAG TPA: hypothetical protein VKS81_03005 [Bacteroidota bacterium]|nr:hypothetical protein [Bacteroidota bacterium]
MENKLNERHVSAGCAVFTVAVLSILTLGQLEAKNRVYYSPDRKVRVVIVPMGKGKNKMTESRLDILAGRRVVRSRDFSSEDGEHGEAVRRGTWTDDGQYFIFNTINSGGQQPWHCATYYFDRSREKIFSLDDYVGPITRDFFIPGHDSVCVFVLNPKKKYPAADSVAVDLRTLPDSPPARKPGR